MTTTEVIRWDTDEQKALRQLAADFTRASALSAAST